MKQIGYLAIDQYGHTYQIGDNPPRKWLLNHFDRQHAEMVYCETEECKTKHIGYIIANLWLTIYKVCEWKATY